MKYKHWRYVGARDFLIEVAVSSGEQANFEWNIIIIIVIMFMLIVIRSTTASLPLRITASKAT